MMPIALGGKVVFQDIWNAARAVDAIAAEAVTFTMAATPFLSDLTDEAVARPADVKSLRTFSVRRRTDPARAGAAGVEFLGANIKHLRLGHDGERCGHNHANRRSAGQDL